MSTLRRLASEQLAQNGRQLERAARRSNELHSLTAMRVRALCTGWKRPEPYLAAILLFIALGAGDSMRRADHQILVRVYVEAVRGYQKYGRPVSGRIIRCRYRPTCSEYSIQAVERFGIGRGLVMTLRRLASCNESVTPGTIDPVPAS